MTNLRIPGPTPCADEALKAMSRQMINHRGPEFGGILQRVTAGVKKVFQTKNDVYILTTSGTGAMETAVVNFLSPGDRVLAYPSALSATASPTSPRPTAPTSRSCRSSGAKPPTRQRSTRRSSQGARLQGRAGHPQRDLDRRDQPARRAGRRRPQARRARNRRCRQQPQRRPLPRSTPGTSTSSSPARRRAGWCRRRWP